MAQRYSTIIIVTILLMIASILVYFSLTDFQDSSPSPNHNEGFPPPYQHELTITLTITDNSSYWVKIPTLYGSVSDHYMEKQLQSVDGKNYLTNIVIQDDFINISANGSIVLQSIVPNNNTNDSLHLGDGFSPPYNVRLLSYKESGSSNIMIQYDYIETYKSMRTHIHFKGYLVGNGEYVMIEYQINTIVDD